MRRATLLCLLISLAATVSAQKKPVVDKRLQGIDTALDKLVKQWKMAGFAVAVVEKNKIIYSNGFGYRDLENKKPVTANTLFAIGSCTKAFTSAILGMLEKEGTVSLDKKTTDYLPSLKFYNDQMSNTINVRDMMTHRTGLPRHDFSWYLFRSSTRDSLMMRMQYLEPNAGVREKWQYNNFMFLLQGMIAEKVTGKTWEENVKAKIFTPLGMTRSNFSIKDLEKDADASLGYMVKDDSIIKKLEYYNIDAMGPAGSINSSVNEMANWVIAWINSGKFNNKEVIPASYRSDAISSQMVISGGTPDKENPDIHFSNYGLGWFLASYRGHFRVEHGGNIDGFSASTSFFPSDSIGIIVLTNQNNSGVTSIARNMIADRMLGLKYINWSGNRLAADKKAKEQEKGMEKSKTDNRVTGTKPSHPLADYEGIYSHPGYGEVEIYLRNDTLFGNVVNDSIWLRHYHYDVFSIKGYDKTDGMDTTSAAGIQANFISDMTGKIERMLIPMEASLKPIEFTYRPRTKALTKDELNKYVGEYELSGMQAKIFLKGDVLYLFVPGQPEYELAASGPHTFILKNLKGFSVKFDLTDKEEVTGVSFIQPNGIFKATKKK